jgi:hypothetical protein
MIIDRGFQIFMKINHILIEIMLKNKTFKVKFSKKGNNMRLKKI